MIASTLDLPVQDKFQLYVYEKGGLALGMVTQLWGITPQPVGYLSKELDQVAKGWLLPPERPHYQSEESKQASDQGYQLDHRGWWVSPGGKLWLPEALQWKILKTLHQLYHLG
jgi:hypothetical protein